MTTTTPTFEANAVRGPFNAAFFTVMGGYLDWLMRSRKQRVFADLPGEIVELGSGVGANFRYLPAGTRVIAVEPNPAMHARLRARGARHEIELELHDVVGERLDLPDASADMVVSSLVLCTVEDPARVLAEVQRYSGCCGRVGATPSSSTAAPRTIQCCAASSGWCAGRGRGSSKDARASATLPM
jgi:SAM-dependent methyltransferase